MQSEGGCWSYWRAKLAADAKPKLIPKLLKAKLAADASEETDLEKLLKDQPLQMLKGKLMPSYWNQTCCRCKAKTDAEATK
jgi:hypothetical protein